MTYLCFIKSIKNMELNQHFAFHNRNIARTYHPIAAEIHTKISAILPDGYTLTKFSDGGGGYGISFYATIHKGVNEIKRIRISDHYSGALSSDLYICGSWNNVERLIHRILRYFELIPIVMEVVEVVESYPDEAALLKIYPNATNIVKGEFDRIAKKSGRELYKYTFTVVREQNLNIERMGVVVSTYIR
jgi:hypothetical protein